MNTFSRLSLFTLVCLGIALVLVGNTADAQERYDFSVSGATGAEFQEGETPTITFTLLDSSGKGVENVEINLVPEKASIVSTSPGTGRTDDRGVLDVVVRIGAASDAWIDAEPLPRSTYGARIRAYLNEQEPPEEMPIIVVLAPIPKTGIAPGDTFTQTIEIREALKLSAWQMDVVFNPNILELIEVEEGDFLEQGGYNAFFLSSAISDSNAAGRIRASQARVGRKPNASPPPNNVLTNPSPGGLTGKGNLMRLTFKLLEFAEEPLGIHNVQLSNDKSQRISYSIQINDLIVATDEYPPEDVDRDGKVNIQDLIMVASDMGRRNSNLGNANPINPRTDVNDDGFVNMLDLITVSSSPHWGRDVKATKKRNANKASLSAPSANAEGLTPATISGWIDLAQVEDDGSAIFDLGIANLEALLAAQIPSKTRLLLNYPNPFNPETWIPYQLSEATDVTVTIHSMNGSLIRTLELGHQAAGIYQSKSQAAYWDGRNEFGEQVASGLYFYTLTAGNFSATGKMLVRK